MIQTSGETTTASTAATATATQPGWSAAGSSLAQNTTAPTATPSTAAPAGTYTPSYTTAPSATTPPYTTAPGAATPTYTQPTAPAVGPTTPTYTAPGTSAPTFAPGYGAAPVATPGPAATFNGTILPPPSWDPYATPGMQQPSLMSQDPYLPTPSLQYPTTAGLTRFLQEVRIDYTWMDGKNDKPNYFSYNNVELTATFALPFLYSQQNPLLVTPGFDFYFLDTPISDTPRAYDAFIDTEWNPQITPYFGGELGFRIGIYSDFEKWDGRALRYTGHGLLTLMLSPSFKLKGGIVYFDRVDVKLLPAGGVVWTPNQDWRFDVLFPNPRISRRMCTSGVSDWWAYVRGEYGGDSWVFSTPINDQVDYNDYRIALGIESVRRGGGGNFLFEVGYAFKRELVARGNRNNPLDVPDTVFLRAGLAF
jgi:hypothetical protein